MWVFPTQGCKYVLPDDKNSSDMFVVSTKSLKQTFQKSFSMVFGKSIM